MGIRASRRGRAFVRRFQEEARRDLQEEVEGWVESTEGRAAVRDLAQEGGPLPQNGFEVFSKEVGSWTSDRVDQYFHTPKVRKATDKICPK